MALYRNSDINLVLTKFISYENIREYLDDVISNVNNLFFRILNDIFYSGVYKQQFLWISYQVCTRITTTICFPIRNKWNGIKFIRFWSKYMKNINFKNYQLLYSVYSRSSAIPPGIANLTNLEILNLANNHIEELPVSISSMPKLRILNLSINRLTALPRGFGAFPVLEVLDLSYNNLSENALPGNFFMMGKIRFLIGSHAKRSDLLQIVIVIHRNSSCLVFGWQWIRAYSGWSWEFEEFANRKLNTWNHQEMAQ